jgi:type III secretion protein O
MFKDLVSIKTFRENKAEIVVGKQRVVLATAEKRRDDRERARDEYRDWATRQERALYKGLCERVVRLRDIEDVQLEIVQFRAEEAKRNKQLTEAEADRDRQARQLDADREGLRLASRMKEKFVELAKVHAEELKQEAERKEEAELEEVAEIRSTRMSAGIEGATA